MTTADDLLRLREVADMVLRARSARLRAAAEQRSALLLQLADLDAAPLSMQPDIPSAQASYLFEGWASGKRTELNLRLAAAQAEWLSQHELASRAFAKSQVITRLAEYSRR